MSNYCSSIIHHHSVKTIGRPEEKGGETVAKKDKKNLGKKDFKSKNCKLAQTCNKTDLTDSVEFANEPFDKTDRKKCARDKKNNN